MKYSIALTLLLAAGSLAVPHHKGKGNQGGTGGGRGGRQGGGAAKGAGAGAATGAATGAASGAATGNGAAAAGTGAATGGANAASGAGAGSAAAASGSSGLTVQAGAQTLVLKEVNGVPGNECLTFRNNGEIVDAACVNTAADRQITPSTASDGSSVLLVQRSFSAGFRPDLVNTQACVGFNGTHFKALPCDAASTQFVTLEGDQLKAGQACDSGHDGAAQLTVDTTGQNCATFTTTNVQPAAA